MAAGSGTAGSQRQAQLLRGLSDNQVHVHPASFQGACYGSMGLFRALQVKGGLAQALS